MPSVASAVSGVSSGNEGMSWSTCGERFWHENMLLDGMTLEQLVEQKHWPQLVHLFVEPAVQMEHGWCNLSCKLEHNLAMEKVLLTPSLHNRLETMQHTRPHVVVSFLDAGARDLGSFD
jgi:hypothetical protein